MNKIDKYILRFADESMHSKTTESRYYYVNSHSLRVSDHISISSNGTEWSIVLDSSNPDNYILYDPRTFHLSVMDYEEAKTFVKGWALMSRTSCRKTKYVNDDANVVGAIKSLLDKISNNEAKRKNLNDVIDLTKLTKVQIKQVQEMILENKIKAEKIQDDLQDNPALLSLSDFTKAQQSAIKSFIKQNTTQSK